MAGSLNTPKCFRNSPICSTLSGHVAASKSILAAGLCGDKGSPAATETNPTSEQNMQCGRSVRPSKTSRCLLAGTPAGKRCIHVSSRLLSTRPNPCLCMSKVCPTKTSNLCTSFPPQAQAQSQRHRAGAGPKCKAQTCPKSRVLQFPTPMFDAQVCVPNPMCNTLASPRSQVPVVLTATPQIQ